MTDTRTTLAPAGRYKHGRSRRPQTNPECAADSHGTANARHNDGCKCREAIDAYAATIAKRRPVRRVQPAQVDGNGNCVAGKHGSYLAWMAGCRCPAACEKREQVMARKVWAGPQPWHGFRGPQQRVSRVNLLLLLSGFVDDPTYMERVVAANILRRRGRTIVEIGRRMGGYDTDAVDGYLRRYAELAGKRTERRLADVKWKAARVARARAKSVS